LLLAFDTRNGPSIARFDQFDRPPGFSAFHKVVRFPQLQKKSLNNTFGFRYHAKVLSNERCQAAQEACYLRVKARRLVRKE
jgi:hypothetical protein